MPPESPEWKHIVQTKGIEECVRRKAFLGKDSDDNGNTIDQDL
jgi:hypothetical protein